MAYIRSIGEEADGSVGIVQGVGLNGLGKYIFLLRGAPDCLGPT